MNTDRAMVGWSWAALVTNMLIIVTGAAVRLTGSGLGCDTWPHCTPGTFTPRPEQGIHSFIEFGNRLLTFVLLAVAVGALVRALRIHRGTRLVVLAAVNLGAIVLQAVVGGISVLTGLNPFVVALHLLLSVANILVCVTLVWRASGRRAAEVDGLVMGTVRTTVALMMVVMWLGTVVTGSGPNAGDHGARRTGFTIETVARLHGISVWLTVAATIACLALGVTRRLPGLRTWATVLLVVEIGQGAIGYSQYFAHLNPWLVIWHLVGVSVAAATVGALWCTVRPRREPGLGPRPGERHLA